jgi:uncharacterized protein YprB with RNaseH-like and TPR domain
LKYTTTEDSLLLKLRNKKLPYKDILEFFPNHSQDSLRNRYYQLVRLNNNSWLKDEKVAVLDIETSDLSANNGMMLTWAIKYLDGTTKSDSITRKEIFSEKFDKRIVKSLLNELKNVDVIIGYYSSGFDLPFLRTRAVFWNLDFPAAGTIKHIDLYYIIKFKFKLTRNSLDMATHFFGIEGKTKLDISVWGLARFGNVEAIQNVLEHNLADCEITLNLYNKIKDLVRITRKTI